MDTVGPVLPAAASMGETRRCGFCGYDLSGGPLLQCPECGKDPANWRLRCDPTLRRFQVAHACVACIPLLYLLAANAAYVGAAVSLGERPGPWNHPDATATLHLLVALLTPTLWLSLVAPGVTWIFASSWMMRKPASACDVRRSLLHMVLVCIACWLVTVIMVVADPLGAIEWIID